MPIDGLSSNPVDSSWPTATSDMPYRIPMQEQSGPSIPPDTLSDLSYSRGVAATEDRAKELEVLKEYLRARAEEWVAGGKGRTRKDFAEESGVSASHVSNVLNGHNPSDDVLIRWLAFLGLGWEEAFRLSAEWQKTRPKKREPVTAMSPDLKAAFDSVSREPGPPLSPSVRDTALQMLRDDGDLKVDEWAQTLRLLRKMDASGRLASSLAAGRSVEMATQPHRRRDRDVHRK